MFFDNGSQRFGNGAVSPMIYDGIIRAFIGHLLCIPGIRQEKLLIFRDKEERILAGIMTDVFDIHRATDKHGRKTGLLHKFQQTFHRLIPSFIFQKSGQAMLPSLLQSLQSFLEWIRLNSHSHPPLPGSCPPAGSQCPIPHSRCRYRHRRPYPVR